MTYVLSDLHGCLDKWREMKEKISLSDRDTVYILGDAVDRGRDGVALLQEFRESKNVVYLRGNHDQTFLTVAANLEAREEIISTEEFRDVFSLWLADGGKPTIDSYLALPAEERKALLLFLCSLPFRETVTVGGKRFFLSHSVPAKKKMKESGGDLYDYIAGEPEYEKVYFEDAFVVTGHTPTSFLDLSFRGKIWKGNNHIDVDCGAVFGNRLGCLCLDTGEEFYAG